MNRTMRVLLAIAIVLSTLQVCALVVSLLAPQTGIPNLFTGLASQAELRWKVYFLSALVSLALGFVMRRRSSLAADAMVIAGIYLMVLANNGGLLARGYEQYRLVTSVLTLAFLLLLATRSDRAVARA